MVICDDRTVEPMTEINRPVLIAFVIGILAGVILIHHGIVHNGILFEGTDFQRSLENLMNSHEGILTSLLLIALGIFIGNLITRRK